MAIALPTPNASNSKFHNWIKAALAVLFTKEELEPVVYDIIEQFKDKCLQDIATSNSLPYGITCSNCCTENFIICPTNGLCHLNRRKCSYHRNAATQYRPSGCPNNICHHLKSKIQNAHRYSGPSFKNSDARQWCSNPWEVAKCYMPPDGYNHVTNPADTDFNGINSIIINHKGFDSKISDDLSNNNNIFVQGRNIGRDVRHSASLEVEDTDLTKYFTILNKILLDPGLIAMNKSPHNARQKLAQLQNDELIIGKDVVCKVLDDTGNAIQERIRKEADAYNDEAEQRQLALIDLANSKIKCLKDQGTISLAQLNESLQSSIDELESKLQDINDGIEQGKQEIKNCLEQGKQDTKDGVEQGKQQIKDGVEQGKQEIRYGVEQGKQEIKDGVQHGKQEIKDGVQQGKEQITAEVKLGKLDVKNGIEQVNQGIKVGVEQGKKDIIDGVEQGRNDIKDEVEMGRLVIEDGVEQGKQDIKDGVEQGKEQITDEVELGKLEIKDGIEQGKQVIKDQVEQGILDVNDGAEQGKQDIKEKVEQGQQEIKEGVEQGNKRLKME